MTDSAPKKETQFMVHQWGPCLAQLKVHDGFIKQLMSLAKSSNTPHNKHLAGIIDKEVSLNKELVIPNLTPYIAGYNQVYEQYTGVKQDPPPQYLLLVLGLTSKNNMSLIHHTTTTVSYLL